MRKIISCIAAVLGCLGCALAQGQSYPNRSVKIVVPFGAAGSSDIVTRIVARRLQEIWAQPVVVDNKPGAGGNIGHEFVAKSPPDGYTLLEVGASFAINPALYRDNPYDPIRDFVPITQIASTPSILMVTNALPATSVKEFVEYAKQHPGQLFYGSGGIGSTPHIAGELLSSMAGIKMVHVPYKAEQAAVQDTIEGRLQVFIGSLPSYLQQVKSGRVRALAVTSSKRAIDLPDVPTLAEAGVAGYEMTGWYGAFAPAGTPADIVRKLQADFVAAIHDPSVAARLQSAGAEPVGSTGPQFTEFLRGELRKWGGVVKSSGARAE